MNYLIIYTIVISAVIPSIRSFILDVYGGMVAWDYMNGGRRFCKCPLKKKKNENDKKIPVLDVSHFLKEAKQNYNDLKNYNDERERQKQAEADRQRQQREQEERDRQEKIKKQKLEQERIEIENQKKLESEKKLQLIREQLKAEEERKRQDLLLHQQARERETIIEEVERLKKIINQQQSGFVDKVQPDRKPPNESASSELCSARIPEDRDDDDAWRDYIFDWKYDHCIITAYA